MITNFDTEIIINQSNKVPSTQNRHKTFHLRTEQAPYTNSYI